MAGKEPSPLELQLRGYRIATAEILYRMPDHPSLIQSFIWQHYDIAPRYPELVKFLTFWEKNIEGPLVGVRVGRSELIKPQAWRHGPEFQLH
jgi:uncharacterized protein Usg